MIWGGDCDEWSLWEMVRCFDIFLLVRRGWDVDGEISVGNYIGFLKEAMLSFFFHLWKLRPVLHVRFPRY